VSVEFITWDGSATVADGDYQPVSTGLLTWDAGDSTSRTIQVPIYGDTAFEPDESLLVLLKNPVGAAFWNDRGTGTIVNDDPFSYVVPSDGQPNDLVLSADGSYVSLTRHEELVFDGEFSQPLPITIAGPQDAAASLAVRWVSPSDVLSAGVQFQGGQTLGDSLLIDDSVAQTVRHTITGDGSGTFTVDGTLISYTDVESVGDYWAPTITGLPTAGAEGTEVQLQALLPDPERVEMSTLQWTVTKDEATIAEVLGAEFRFTPSDDGQYVVSVTATAEGAATATTTHTLTIHNLAPQLEAGADETLMPPVAGAFRRNGIVFSDPGADVWNGTVNFGDGSGAQALTIDQAAKTFDLAHTFTAEGSFTVTVTVCDDDGGAASDTFQVTVSLNTPPVAEAGGPYSVAEGRTILLDAFGSADRQQPSNTLIYEWDFDGDGEYDDATGIAPTFSAALLDGLTSVLIGLKVTDSYGEWRTDTATVTVVNAAPVATADSATTEEDAEVAVGVLANDSDAAGPADPLQIVGVSNGAHGMARIDDNGTSDTTNDRIVYTPDANFNGTDSFTYTIGDGDGGIATATVTVTVNPVNDTPTMASPIADVTVDEDVAAVIVDLAGVFGDVDIATNNDALTLSVSGNTNAALVTPTLNGTRLTSRRWSSAAVFPWPTFERSARGGVPATTTSM
jgi:hypothetical protein